MEVFMLGRLRMRNRKEKGSSGGLMEKCKKGILWVVCYMEKEKQFTLVSQNTQDPLKEATIQDKEK